MAKLMVGAVVSAQNSSAESICEAKKLALNRLVENILTTAEDYDIFIVKESATGVTVGIKVVIPNVDMDEDDVLQIRKV